MGEDKSFSVAENARLAEEVKLHRDIIITPDEEGPNTGSTKTKHCIYWVTKMNKAFDLLIKTDDQSTLFLSRLVGTGGWLTGVKRDDYVYFGKKHPLKKVSNPQNFELDEPVNTFSHFEFDFRGSYWPEYMEGGMYGFSRRLSEEIVKNDFRTYTSEDAMVGVWVSSLHTDTLYLEDDQVLQSEKDFSVKNGTRVVAAFETDNLRLASMWCEYGPLGTLSRSAMIAENPQQALDCLGSYQRGALKSRSEPLAAGQRIQDRVLAMLAKERPKQTRPDPAQTGKWWQQMGRVFRGQPAAVIGNTGSVDRLPLYLLQGMHALVLDDFFQVSERYTSTSWAPTMYMCVDPSVCASEHGGTAARTAAGGRRATGRKGEYPPTAESANRFARNVFAAFYLMESPDGVEYWKYLRERVNAYWFFTAGGGGGGKTAVPGMGLVTDGLSTENNFRVVSRKSGVAMGIEVLSYLGFSPIYVTGAREELKSQWDEVSHALHTASSVYGAQVIYLFGHDADRLDPSMMAASAKGEPTRSGALMSTQQHIVRSMMKRHGVSGEKTLPWELRMFLRNFPVISRLEINRNARSLEAMFPGSPRCRDAEDLDRFQKAVLCPVKISLEHFSSFLAWHLPYGPVGDMFVWAKR
ncbi:unnamed protein product [Sphacelaria rigidula]